MTEKIVRKMVLKLQHGNIFYCPNKFVPVENTSLAARVSDAASIFFSSPVYWEVALMRFDKPTRTIVVSIEDYACNAFEKFDKQKAKSQLKGVYFSNLDVAKISECMEISEANLQQAQQSYLEDTSITSTQIPLNEIEANFEKAKAPPEISLQLKPFKYSFKDARFELGRVSFSYRVPELYREVSFHIANENILPEFDTIKQGIAAKLKKKFFDVKPGICKFKNNEPVAGFVPATSETINRIDDKLLKIVCYQRTIRLKSSPSNFQPDKSLFSAEEVFSAFEDDSNIGNVFDQNEMDILDIMKGLDGVRNQKQLEYLSGALHSNSEPFRITLNPHFGFLFLYEGKKMYHYIWELLNTNSTYIWSLEKHLDNVHGFYHRIEQTISLIRDLMRTQYKMAYKGNEVDPDLVFAEVRHEKINSDFVDAFALWKSKILEKLV